MTNLSPAAQAILDACDQAFDQCGTTAQGLAAALQTAADQVLPIEYETIQNCWYEKENSVREQLLAIAAELKNC